MIAAFVCTLVLASPAADAETNREALQKFNEFVGEWKGSGQPDRAKVEPREMWKESVAWSWKFKGDDAWLTFTVKNGKYLKSGEVRYKPDAKKYELTTTDAKNQKAVYLGQRDTKGYTTFERVDPQNGETQQIVMNTAADGVRFIYRYAVKSKDRTIFTKVYQVAANKEGETMAAKSSGRKGPECIVTGGLGTISVSYKGQTFYVCCTGCKEAFESDPEKYIKAAKK